MIMSIFDNWVLISGSCLHEHRLMVKSCTYLSLKIKRSLEINHVKWIASCNVSVCSSSLQLQYITSLVISLGFDVHPIVCALKSSADYERNIVFVFSLIRVAIVNIRNMTNVSVIILQQFLAFLAIVPIRGYLYFTLALAIFFLRYHVGSRLCQTKVQI